MKPETKKFWRDTLKQWPKVTARMLWGSWFQRLVMLGVVAINIIPRPHTISSYVGRFAFLLGFVLFWGVLAAVDKVLDAQREANWDALMKIAAERTTMIDDLLRLNDALAEQLRKYDPKVDAWLKANEKERN